jgi:glycosyltransferase involved in cell wall biosynthesis
MDIIKKNIEEMNARLPASSDGAIQANLRILLVSTHIRQVTGYSKVAYNLVKQIAAIPKVRLMHYGFQRYTGPHEGSLNREYPAGVEEIDVIGLPGAKADGGFGFLDIVQIIKTRKPDIVMFYNDLSVISRYVEFINKSELDRTAFKVWIYADQIYGTQKKVYLDIVNRDADRVFAFSEYWKGVLKSQGVHRPISIINHGFETADFPVKDKKEIRKKIGLPDDAFIFMSLNRNQPRKRLDLLVMAFAELVVKHPQKPVHMIMVCDKGDKGGWNLFDIYAREIKLHGGLLDILGNRLMITSENMSYSDDDINTLYNAADVGVSCAEGEGWGLCSFEMMGVGKPQVVSDVGGHKDFCIDGVNSQVVPAAHRYYLPDVYCALGGEAWAVDPSEFSGAMEKYVMDSELVVAHGEAAKKKIGEYTWEKVTRELRKWIEREVEDHGEN